MGLGLYEQMMNEKIMQINIQSAKSHERNSFYSYSGIKHNETKHNYNFIEKHANKSNE